MFLVRQGKEKTGLLEPLKFRLGKQWVTHWFLYMPECPLPLLGRDLLSKLESRINFKDGEIELLIPESKAIEARVFMLQDSFKEEQIPEEVESTVMPLVWANEVPGRSKLAEPVKVTLKPGSKPVKQKQYPIKWEA